MNRFSEPAPENDYLDQHVRILRDSLRHWCGQDLVESGVDEREAAKWLYHAPFVVLSHDTQSDPVFDYANLCAQKLFATNWLEITALNSRKSAEPVERAERARLLSTVESQGFIDHYQGIRIAKNGRRFRVSNAIVWNLITAEGSYYGQAAKFDQWEYLDE